MKKVARLRNPEEISVGTGIAVRTTGRIKKAKVVFDPSDNYLPRPPRTSAGSATSQHLLDNLSDSSNERRQKDEKHRVLSVDSFDGSICYLCGRKDSKKGKAKLISCKDCDLKAHINCFQLDFEDLNTLRENYRCDVCRICSSCYEGPEDGELITCTKCVNSFHYACHVPSMAGFPTQPRWNCSKCTIPKPKSLLKTVDRKVQMPILKPEIENLPEAREMPKTMIITKAVENVQNPMALTKTQKMNDQLTNGSKLTHSTLMNSGDVPNVKQWSSNEVMEYFKKFFPEEAHLFMEHDIDGQSLLMMKRSDVVTKLAIKLGPALRMYNLILQIQSQSTDPTLGW